MASWHIGLYTPTLIFCYAMGTTFFLQIVPFVNPQSFFQPLSFDFVGFKNGDVKLEGDAFLVNETIYLTKIFTVNSDYSFGRVISNTRMQLWDKNTGQLSDFATRFSFMIYSDGKYYSDGLAFFLADPNIAFPNAIREGGGGGLGLVDGVQVLNSTQHSFVAVEFDTYQNQWDPQGIHVGLDFNSVNSTKTKQWVINISQRRVYNCSIEYNSSTLNLSVSFTEYGEDQAELIWVIVDLRNYLPEWVILGFSAVMGYVVEEHSLHSWSFTNLQLGKNDRIPETQTEDTPTASPISENKDKLRSLVGLGIGMGLIVIFLVLMCISLWKWIRGKKEELVFDLIMDHEFQKGSIPKRFSYNELASATNRFAELNKLGQGGFGSVYKGHLKDCNTDVAIKRISRDSRQGITEYATEVKIISQLRHRNLVQLLGWCHKKNDLLLIYEFMPNGSLDSHLFDGKSLLTWPARYNLALSLASALLYLQEEWEQCVIHRDIKSSNIMLDSSFNAKLGDFGLARLVDHEKGSKTTQIAGTRGYIAPEYIASGKATKESDIYSFGVVLLEIVSGKKPIDLEDKEDLITLIEWVWELYGMRKSLEIVDPKLCGNFDEQQMERVVGVGLWCAHPDYSFRPLIRQVIQVLKFESPLPILPEKMPVPTYLPPSIRALFSSVSSSLVIDTNTLH